MVFVFQQCNFFGAQVFIQLGSFSIIANVKFGDYHHSFGQGWERERGKEAQTLDFAKLFAVVLLIFSLT